MDVLSFVYFDRRRSLEQKSHLSPIRGLRMSTGGGLGDGECIESERCLRLVGVNRKKRMNETKTVKGAYGMNTV